MEKPESDFDVFRRIGALLSAASVGLYVAGYLTLRARAHALGTDPGFALVDQIYVFAGFRFLLQTLGELLYVMPVVLVIAALARVLAARLPAVVRQVGAWTALILLAVLTFASLSTVGVAGVLLGPARATAGSLKDALTPSILGVGPAGVFIPLGATLCAALTLLWLHARYRHGGFSSVLTRILGAVALMQLVLLPLQHGIFLADNTGRALGRMPEGLKGVLPPAWLLDRGTDRASLLARSADGALCLVTVQVSALDGIPVTRIAPLDKIVQELRDAPAAPPGAGARPDSRGTP